MTNKILPKFYLDILEQKENRDAIKSNEDIKKFIDENPHLMFIYGISGEYFENQDFHYYYLFDDCRIYLNDGFCYDDFISTDIILIVCKYLYNYEPDRNEDNYEMYEIYEKYSREFYNKLSDELYNLNKKYDFCSTYDYYENEHVIFSSEFKLLIMKIFMDEDLNSYLVRSAKKYLMKYTLLRK